eukprot:m.256264 g.256264  ORF g.256264 m.256264 type:complete len:67 (+) comp15951_c0_seq6:2400-2600(+)
MCEVGARGVVNASLGAFVRIVCALSSPQIIAAEVHIQYDGAIAVGLCGDHDRPENTPNPGYPGHCE